MCSDAKDGHSYLFIENTIFILVAPDNCHEVIIGIPIRYGLLVTDLNERLRLIGGHCGFFIRGKKLLTPSAAEIESFSRQKDYTHMKEFGF